LGDRGKNMKKISYSDLAIGAMHRASIQAVERAASFDLKIPEWQDGKIIFICAKEKLKKMKAVDEVS
jgi:hypothetical protein